MATEAQIRANRRNAAKSTGPKTEEGKARSRLNALKNGMRAHTVGTVLPHESSAELERKIQEWIDDLDPRNTVERDLVVEAAKTAWSLERADRFESAYLARRVRKALAPSRARRVSEVCELGRKLFYMSGKRILPTSGPEWNDNPAAFLAGLEASAEGCRWIAERWGEFKTLVATGQPWSYIDQFKFVRLLGKHPVDAIHDPELNRVFLAWETIEADSGTRFWEQSKEMTPLYDPAYSAWGFWRAIAAPPADEAEGKGVLLAIADREIARIAVLLTEHAEIDGANLDEVADRAAFDASAAGERLRRFQSARNRDLTRLLDALAKLRKAPFEKEKAPKEPNRRTETTTPQAEMPPSSPEPPPNKAKAAPRERKEAKTRMLTSQAIETVVAEGVSEFVISLIKGEQAQAGRAIGSKIETKEANPTGDHAEDLAAMSA